MNYLIILLVISLVKANIYFELNNDIYNEVRNSRNFTGKVVLVTGSNSGIGEGIVKLFSVLGASVVVTGRNETNIREVAHEVQQLSPHGLKPLEVVADVTKSDDLKRLINQTINRFGKLDVLVNNAGIAAGVTIRDNTFMEVFDKIIKTDLRAVLEITHLSVPYLEETNGTIITISSIAALKPSIGLIAYGVAKTSLDMMTRVLALELGPRIRVNTINPGTIESPMVNTGAPDYDFMSKVIKKYTPLGKIGIPLDIAKSVVFLASSDAQYITGANIVVDGGQHYNFPGDVSLLVPTD